MKGVFARALVMFVVCVGIGITLNVRLNGAFDPDNNPTVMPADHALVEALAKADKAAVGKLFYTDFFWTNSAGETLSREQVLEALPKPPLGHESDSKVTEYTYDQVAEVRVDGGQTRILRVWIKDPSGWKLLAYHEVRLADHPPASGGPSANDCVVPCQSVPYRPKDEAEKGVFASWAGLELALTTHNTEAWVVHFPEEYIMVNSKTPVPITKSDRIKAIRNPAPESNCKTLWSAGRLCQSQLAAKPKARFFHFGKTVVIISEDKPFVGKSQHDTRIWHPDPKTGIYQMMESWSSTIQSAPTAVPPKS
jgi:Domain of unknown function (DUF4440)